MDRIRPATYVLEPGVYTDTLPPLHTVEVPLAMDMTDYETMRKNFVLEFGGDEKVIATNAAVVAQKLTQLSAGFTYLNGDARWLSSHKMDALADLLEENQRAPTIVWYQYKAELAELQRRFPQSVTLDGDDSINRWNAGKVEVLLAHPLSAQYGLNLQHGGCRMVWLTLTWSLTNYEQAIGRLHRSGQRHDVWNYVLVTEKTIDEKIMDALKHKRSAAELALEALR
jgi:SNF2 family DNA or RNA helicase